MKRFNKVPEYNSEQGIYIYSDNYSVYYCKLSGYVRNILIDLYPPTITYRYGVFF